MSHPSVRRPTPGSIPSRLRRRVNAGDTSGLRGDQSNQALPWSYLIHLDQEVLAASPLTFAGVLGIREGHLFHQDSTAVFVSGRCSTRLKVFARIPLSN